MGVLARAASVGTAQTIVVPTEANSLLVDNPLVESQPDDMQTILLVEDSKFLRIATERALTKAGYHVVIAIDGEEAVREATAKIPDLVILDMLLPKLSGPEVLHKLKANLATAHIPVLVLSSLSQKNEDKLIEEGAAAFLEKGPLLENPSLLLKAIKTALTKKAAAPQS